MRMIGYYYMADEKILNRIRNSEFSIDDLMYSDSYYIDRSKCIDVDKSWHAIHFTLTGKAYDVCNSNPLSKVVLGGNFVNNKNIYSPVLYITPEEVKTTYKSMEKIDESYFRMKFNMKNMIKNKVYPVMKELEKESFFKYVWGGFQLIKAFFRVASKNNYYILFHVNL